MELLKDLDIDGYRLQLWDTNTTDSYGKQRICYKLLSPDGSELFSGSDFFPSPLHAVDSDETVRSILSFLTLRPGDTDEEYFSSYSKKQLEWAETEAEELSVWSMEPDECEECDGCGCDECGDTGVYVGGPRTYDGSIFKPWGWVEEGGAT